MFRTLIVPLDGSELAERALPYATQLAVAQHGRLILVRVAIAPPSARLDGADWEQLQVAAVAEAEAYVTGIATKLRTRVPVDTRVTYGRAAAGILHAVTDLAADAVVMATHGRTGLKHLMYGSVAEAVVAETSVPVFLVRDRPAEPPAPVDPTKARVVVPLDGSAFAESALPTAMDFVSSRGNLVLVSVIEQPDHVQLDETGRRVIAYLDQQEEAVTRTAREYLADVAARLKRQQPDLQVDVDVRIGEPADGIIMAAVDDLADLVVMASHGLTRVPRAVHGSVTGAVLREGSTPVLVSTLAAAAAARA